MIKDIRPIKRVLVSLADKESFLPFIKDIVLLAEQHHHPVELLSTGETAKVLREQGLSVILVEEVTAFPPLLGGRVKTLHPKIHGALLASPDNQAHQKEMQHYGITPVDMVIVSLYPFEKAVKDGLSPQRCLEQIDIGGSALLRAGAKNADNVSVICDTESARCALEDMKKFAGIRLKTRKQLAYKTFSLTARYDALIAQYLQKKESGESFPPTWTLTGTRKQVLRYGENPHQKAAAYVTTQGGLLSASQLQGKELSFNNLLDGNSAWKIVTALAPHPCPHKVVIVKHGNPCGVAKGASLLETWNKALHADKISAFGGIIAVNSTIHKDVAEAMTKEFIELVLCPSLTEEAKSVFQRKKSLRLLVTAAPPPALYESRPISGGFLVQEADTPPLSPDTFQVVTHKAPTPQQMEDLLFAFDVCRFVQSNAIVLAKDGVTVGIGAGQMNRLDSVSLALQKAAQGKGLVAASDAFFPFPDALELLAKAKVEAVIQPGGAKRDQEVISSANRTGLAMVMTRRRAFSH